MNMNYGYPTTMDEMTLAQMYVFLVLFTFLLFLIKSFESQICSLVQDCGFTRSSVSEFGERTGLKKNSTRNLYISAKILSYILIE